MLPTMNCPTGTKLEGNMCTVKPTFSCPNGYTLYNDEECVSSGMVMSSNTSTTEFIPNIPYSSGDTMPNLELNGKCPIGYMYLSADNMCYPI